MIVKELIEALKIMDPNRIVCFPDENGPTDVSHITDEGDYILLE